MENKPSDQELIERIFPTISKRLDNYLFPKSVWHDKELIFANGLRDDIVALIKELGYRLIDSEKLTALSDKEIWAAFNGDWGEAYFDHKPTYEDMMLIKLKLVSQATTDWHKEQIRGMMK